MSHFFLRLLALMVLLAWVLEVPILSASQIGTGTVSGSGGLSSPINWNDTFVGSSASGTINGVIVT